MIGLAAATIMGVLLAVNVMVANAQQQQMTTKIEKVWETPA
jgi:hypothetical protein